MRRPKHSKRVSSETGVAYSDQPAQPTRYQQQRDEIEAILRTMPPDERRAMIADLAKRLIVN